MAKFNLSSNFNPDIIKSLSYEELDVLSMELRNEIINKCSIYGGHLASNLGVVELTIALFRCFDFPKDKLLFDVGHQCYSHKILTGRSLDNLRQENGISGFQKRSESIYDCFEAGHSSTSISAATGMAIARDLDNKKYHIISVIGDSSFSNGLALEAINNLATLNNKVIVILNDNEMSISKPVGGIHNMLHKIDKNEQLSLNWFESLGIDYLGKIDGHNIKALEEALEKAKNNEKSIVVHISTIKGKGYIHAEKDEKGFFHGTGPFDIATGKDLTSPKDDEASWSKIYSRLLEVVLKENEKAVVINPATTVGNYLNRIMQLFPTRSFDVGIAEEHAVSMASGLALNNYHPYISIYSSFLQRSYDQINQDIARMNLPCTFLIDRAGLVGNDGETHQGIFDCSFIMNMPNIAIAMAKDQTQAAELMKLSANYNYPFAIRYPRSNTEYKTYSTLKDTKNIEFGKWEYEINGKNNDVCVISFGPAICELKEKLKEDKISLVNAIFQKPFDIELLKKVCKFKHIFVYDPYGIEEGFCFHIQNILGKLNYAGSLHLYGLKNEFVSCGSITQQLKRYNLDIDSIIEKIKNII